MKMQINQVYTVAGKDANEDAIGCGENYLFVLDASSGIEKTHITYEQTDARWFSHTLRDYLCKELDKQEDLPIQYILKSVIEKIKAEFIGMAKAKKMEIPEDSPNASIALFRVLNNELEFYGLGDCIGVVNAKDGESIISVGDILPKFKQNVIDQMVEISKEKNIDVLKCKRFVRKQINENKSKINTKEGYYILDLSSNGIEHGHDFKMPLDQVESIFVASDGYGQLVEPFHVYKDLGELAKESINTPLEEIIIRLFALQDKDKTGNEYPRLKFRKDTSCATAIIN